MVYVRDTKLREYISILISLRALFFSYYYFLTFCMQTKLSRSPKTTLITHILSQLIVSERILRISLPLLQ